MPLFGRPSGPSSGGLEEVQELLTVSVIVDGRPG
jgi:hypothetical protein